MSDTGRDDRVTRYLMYRVGLRSGESDFSKTLAEDVGDKLNLSSGGVFRPRMSAVIERCYSALRLRI